MYIFLLYINVAVIIAQQTRQNIPKTPSVIVQKNNVPIINQQTNFNSGTGTAGFIPTSRSNILQSGNHVFLQQGFSNVLSRNTVVLPNQFISSGHRGQTSQSLIQSVDPITSLPVSNIGSLSNIGNLPNTLHPGPTNTGNSANMLHAGTINNGNFHNTLHPRLQNTRNLPNNIHQGGVVNTANLRNTLHPLVSNTGNLPNDLQHVVTNTGNLPNTIHPVVTNTGNLPNTLQQAVANTGNLPKTLKPRVANTGNLPNTLHPVVLNTEIVPNTFHSVVTNTENLSNTIHPIVTNTGGLPNALHARIIDTRKPTVANTGNVPVTSKPIVSNTGNLPNSLHPLVLNTEIVPNTLQSDVTNTGNLPNTIHEIDTNTGSLPNALHAGVTNARNLQNDLHPGISSTRKLHNSHIFINTQNQGSPVNRDNSKTNTESNLKTFPILGNPLKQASGSSISQIARLQNIPNFPTNTPNFSKDRGFNSKIEDQISNNMPEAFVNKGNPSGIFPSFPMSNPAKKIFVEKIPNPKPLKQMNDNILPKKNPFPEKRPVNPVNLRNIADVIPNDMVHLDANDKHNQIDRHGKIKSSAAKDVISKQKINLLMKLFLKERKNRRRIGKINSLSPRIPLVKFRQKQRKVSHFPNVPESVTGSRLQKLPKISLTKQQGVRFPTKQHLDFEIPLVAPPLKRHRIPKITRVSKPEPLVVEPKPVREGMEYSRGRQKQLELASRFQNLPKSSLTKQRSVRFPTKRHLDFELPLVAPPLKRYRIPKMATVFQPEPLVVEPKPLSDGMEYSRGRQKHLNFARLSDKERKYGVTRPLRSYRQNSASDRKAYKGRTDDKNPRPYRNNNPYTKRKHIYTNKGRRQQSESKTKPKRIHRKQKGKYREKRKLLQNILKYLMLQ